MKRTSCEDYSCLCANAKLQHLHRLLDCSLATYVAGLLLVEKTFIPNPPQRVEPQINYLLLRQREC